MPNQFIAAVGICLWLSGCGSGRTAIGDVEEGNRLFQAGKFADASILYRKAVQKDPKLAEAYYRLGLNVFREGNFREGYVVLSKAASLAPERSDIKITIADVCLELYLQEGSSRLYNELTKISDEILAEDPNSFDGLRLKGTQAMLDHKPGDAATYLQKANQLRPMEQNVVLVLSQALFQDNKQKQAEQLALELIKKEKTFVPIYDLLLTQYIAQKRPVDAENILKLKVQNNPSNVLAIQQLAGHYATTGRNSEMFATLKPLTDNPQSFPNGRIQIVEFYKALGKSEEALQRLEEGSRIDTKNAAVYRKGIVNVLLDKGKRKEALQAVDALVREYPKDLEALALRAVLWVDEADRAKLDTAIVDLMLLKKEKPKDPKVRFNLGRALWRKGDRTAASAEFREAARDWDTAPAARLALAEISLEEQRPREAIRLSEEALRRTPNDRNFQLLHGAGLLGTGDVKGAKREIEALARQYPKFRDAQLKLAIIAIQERKFKQAEEIFRRLYQMAGEDVRPALGLAETMSAQNHLDGAIQFLEGEVKKAPQSVALRRTLAAAAAHGGKLDVAIEHYMYLSTAEPSSVDHLLELGALYDRKGDFQKAIANFEKAGEKSPKDPRPLAFLANTLRRANRAEEARAVYQRALNNAPGNPVLLNNLAFLLASSGENLDTALGMAQRAVKNAPNQPAFADTLGWIYLKQNKTDSAFQIFNGLVKKSPDNATFRHHLGLTFLQKGDKESARKEFEVALKNKPGPAEESEIKQLLAR